MRRALATGGNAVVTDRTVIHKISMVNIGRHPCRSRMTIVALLRRNNMRGRLAAGRDIIMATGAGANDLRVIHGAWRYRRPQFRRDAVTRVALVGSADMGCRFTRGDYAIVATDTRSGQLRMVHSGRLHGIPWRGSRCMAGIALIRAWNMGGSFAGCHDAIMTTHASADHLRVIHVGHRDG